jgi:hypothetical protein
MPADFSMPILVVDDYQTMVLVTWHGRFAIT